VPNGIGRNDLCPCGSGVKYKKCCLGTPADPATADGTLLTPPVPLDGPRPPAREPSLTVVVDTPDGPMARLVPSASPLPPQARYGAAAETATHDAAALWGLPDFVFLPETADVGSGRRELGDGIVLVGRHGVVLQVKGRETPTDDEAREHSWLEKKSAQALRQGNGTIRTLIDRQLEMTNLRGTTIEVDGSDYAWINVVVLDHADPPEGLTLALDESKFPAVIMLRRDWDFIFDQLKSTHAVCEYLRRVADDPLEIGHEPVRYYDLARADSEAHPDVLDPALVGVGEPISAPLLPLAPAATEDRPANVMFRSILEDIAITRLQTAREADRLRVLGELDRTPVQHRGLVGQHLIDAMAEVARANTGIAWKLKSIRGPAGGVHLGFGACNRPHSEEIAGMFSLWTQLRHFDMVNLTGDQTLTTVAVLLTPRESGRRRWDTTMSAVSGELGFDDEDLARLRELWPSPIGETKPDW